MLLKSLNLQSLSGIFSAPRSASSLFTNADLAESELTIQRILEFYRLFRFKPPIINASAPT